MKYKICDKCKNIIEIVNEKSNLVSCCGEKMSDLIPNTKEAAIEKHIPVFEINDNIVTVTVGETIHPMEEKHYIMWIAIKTNQGMQRKYLNYDDKPVASFAIVPGEELEEVYAFCNLHGLWKKEINK